MAGFALGTAVALVHSLWVTRATRLWRGEGWTDRQVVTTTLPLFVGLLGTALMLNLDILGLKLLALPGMGDELAGFYQAAVILARTPVFVAQSLTLVLFSYVAGSKGETSARPEEMLRQGSTTGDSRLGYVWDAVRAWVRLLLPAGLVLMLAPRAALSLFFPLQYQAAAPALRVAAAGGVFLALVTMLTGVLQAAGDRRRPAIAAALATLTQVVVLVWLVPVWGALGAAASLLAAGGVALIGLAPALRGQVEIRLLREGLPLLALVMPLLFLPDGGRGAALLKLGLAGLSYFAVLLGVHRWTVSRTERPAALFGQFVHILMGG
jgi:O-antigen/teichoic acid export membrane protein